MAIETHVRTVDEDGTIRVTTIALGLQAALDAKTTSGATDIVVAREIHKAKEEAVQMKPQVWYPEDLNFLLTLAGENDAL